MLAILHGLVPALGRSFIWLSLLVFDLAINIFLVAVVIIETRWNLFAGLVLINFLKKIKAKICDFLLGVLKNLSETQSSPKIHD